jgi:hypothetical protein
MTLSSSGSDESLVHLDNSTSGNTQVGKGAVASLKVRYIQRAPAQA